MNQKSVNRKIDRLWRVTETVRTGCNHSRLFQHKGRNSFCCELQRCAYLGVQVLLGHLSRQLLLTKRISSSVDHCEPHRSCGWQINCYQGLNGRKTASQERQQLKLLQVASLLCRQPCPHSKLPALWSPYDAVHFHTSDNHSFPIIIRRHRLPFKQDLHVTGGDRQSNKNSLMH